MDCQGGAKLEGTLYPDARHDHVMHGRVSTITNGRLVRCLGIYVIMSRV
jgi:hypothetical protein